MKKTPVAYRFTPALKKMIKTVARMEKRSNNNLVEKIVSDYCTKKIKRVYENDGN